MKNSDYLVLVVLEGALPLLDPIAIRIFFAIGLTPNAGMLPNSMFHPILVRVAVCWFLRLVGPSVPLLGKSLLASMPSTGRLHSSNLLLGVSLCSPSGFASGHT